MQLTDAPSWRSITEVTREAGISPTRVRQLIWAGRLRAERTSLGWLIDPRSVREYEAERAARLARKAAGKRGERTVA